MTIHGRRRLWYWQAVHYLSVIRLRKRVVFGSAVLGVLAAIIITATTTPIFSSRVTLRVKGMVASDDSCGSDPFQQPVQQTRNQR